MRITTNKTSKGTSYYIIRSIRRDGKRSSEVVENLGTDKEIIEKYGCQDVDAWVRAHLDELNQKEKEKDHKVLIPFNTDAQIPMDRQLQFNIGYLFLQQIYYDLKLPQICNKIKSRYEFDYDLDSILSRLVYGRILYPSSKLSCFEQSNQLLEAPQFELHQIYRALSVLARESDVIQSALYENSKKVIRRQTGVLYYDCTNFFFETEKESGLRQYGVSKEHRPNPIVQMGLFMDKSGIPLAMSITPGNTNEQTTLKPLEMKLMKDFELSQFVVCTDAGLSSEANRKFNNFGGRGFITTQSIKKMKASDRSWCLSPTGWHLSGDRQSYDLRELNESDPKIQELTFYKQKLIEGYDSERDISFQQTLIVTYSIKYRNYEKTIRDQQVARAQKTLESSKNRIDTCHSNDYRRFIKKVSVTNDGEIAPKKVYSVDQTVIDRESAYDGFYAVMTNLDDDIEDILAVNRCRWEIEESFRIMKTEFSSRPVYLSRDDRIQAHFLTCFISLLIYRILEQKLGGRHTCHEIITTLRSMNVVSVGDEGYIPAYTRTVLTDHLHEASGFRTDYEIIRKRKMSGIIRKSKSKANPK